MKKQVKTFLRTVYISSVLLFCLISGFYGISKAYESMRLIGFGEYRSAIEFEDGKLKLFDFEIVIRK